MTRNISSSLHQACHRHPAFRRDYHRQFHHRHDDADGGTNPTGTITFKIYGPDDSACGAAAVFTSTKIVNGNGDYTSDSYTPTAAGTYRFVASYSGDADNQPGGRHRLVEPPTRPTRLLPKKKAR